MCELINKFADNTKIGKVVHCEEGCQMILQVVDQLEIWVGKWQEEFNPDNVWRCT